MDLTAEENTLKVVVPASPDGTADTCCRIAVNQRCRTNGRDLIGIRVRVYDDDDPNDRPIRNGQSARDFLVQHTVTTLEVELEAYLPDVGQQLGEAASYTVYVEVPYEDMNQLPRPVVVTCYSDQCVSMIAESANQA